MKERLIDNLYCHQKLYDDHMLTECKYNYYFCRRQVGGTMEVLRKKAGLYTKYFTY